MSKLDDAAAVLRDLGLPEAQRNERSQYTLLALSGLKEADKWIDASANLMRIVDIMSWMEKHYGKKYAPNSRETIRRQTIHQFEQAHVVEKNPDSPKRPTNSGNTVYRLTSTALDAIRSFGKPAFEYKVTKFIESFGALEKRYRGIKDSNRVPVKLPGGKTVDLSPGSHNELQAAVIQSFMPRFVKDGKVLYLGDSVKKHLIIETAALMSLGVSVTEHDKLPDIVIHSAERNWIFLIEAVTSHGPISPKRFYELEEMLRSCTAGKIYVTAFLTASDFRKYAGDIAWESEVWIAEQPDHMIHYNGDRFFGPRNAGPV